MTGVVASPSPDTEDPDVTDGVVNDKLIGDNSADCGTSEVPTEKTTENSSLGDLSKDLKESAATEIEKPPEWVEWRESSDSLEPTEKNIDSAVSSTAATSSAEISDAATNSPELSEAAANIDPHDSVPESVEQTDATTVPVAPSTDISELSSVDTPPALLNDESEVELKSGDGDSSSGKADDSPSSTGQTIDVEKSNTGGLPEPVASDTSPPVCQPSEGEEVPSSLSNVDKLAETEAVTSGAAELEVEK